MVTRAAKAAADRQTALMKIEIAENNPGLKMAYMTHANSRIRSLFKEIERRVPDVVIEDDILTFSNGAQVIGEIVIGARERSTIH